ncbi:MAG: hypothetical protein KF830_16610 [Planctomycetes bacterium]|nr:hypothetical protein [Planctomycetota bacterium]
MARRLGWLLALAVLVRAVGCALRPMPARDGVAYLWLAERTAHGDLGGLFDTVFHPLYPLLVGLLLAAAPGLAPEVAGQLVAAGSSALTVVPLFAVARRLHGATAATWAAAMFALGAWFVRHPAECMSEGCFHLLVATWALAAVHERARPGLGGIAAGLAFLVRPEGAAAAVVGAWFFGRRLGMRAALVHAGAAAAVASLLPLGALASGHGFVLTPKAAFNWSVGAGGAGSALAHYAEQWLRLPGNAWEGLGYLVFPLAVAGVAGRWRRGLDDRERLLLVPFLVQCAVLPLLFSHHRFVSGYGVLLLPFAGHAAAALAARPGWRIVLPLLLVASEAKLWLATPTDRGLERELGRWLAGQLAQGETLATDMPRVVYFAGRAPPPPRPILAADLQAWAAAPGCRFVALRTGRTDEVVPRLRALGYDALALPPHLQADPAAASVQLWARPR